MTSTRKTALIADLLFLATFVAAIAGALLYAPVLHPADYIVGAGTDTRVRLGAFCELILIIANVGTAVVLFPILKRQNESLALGYVAARLLECTFIAIGIVSLLAVVTLRPKAAGADAGSLVRAGKSLVAVRNWTFVLGPGFVVGVGNGLILGYLMYRSRLVPRRRAAAPGSGVRSASDELRQQAREKTAIFGSKGLSVVPAAPPPPRPALPHRPPSAALVRMVRHAN